MGWDGPMTHRQHLAWLAWLDWKLTVPDQTAWHLINVERAVECLPYQVWGNTPPDEVAGRDRRLKFSRAAPNVANAPETMGEQISAARKSALKRGGKFRLIKKDKDGNVISDEVVESGGKRGERTRTGSVDRKGKSGHGTVSPANDAIRKSHRRGRSRG